MTFVTPLRPNLGPGEWSSPLACVGPQHIALCSALPRGVLVVAHAGSDRAHCAASGCRRGYGRTPSGARLSTPGVTTTSACARSSETPTPTSQSDQAAYAMALIVPASAIPAGS